MAVPPVVGPGGPPALHGAVGDERGHRAGLVPAGRCFVMVEGGWGLTLNRLDVFLDFSAVLERRFGTR